MEHQMAIANRDAHTPYNPRPAGLSANVASANSAITENIIPQNTQLNLTDSQLQKIEQILNSKSSIDQKQKALNELERISKKVLNQEQKEIVQKLQNQHANNKALKHKKECNTMKKIICWLFLGLSLSIVNATDSIDIKVEQDINFDDGFGMLKAQPILNGVKDIQLMGEYNVNSQNGNVEMKFDKVIYKDQTYTLTEPFVKRARLKNPKKAVLKKDSKIKIAGGSKSEILNILNSPSSTESRNRSSNSSSGTGGAISGSTRALRGNGTNGNSGSYGYGSNTNGYSNGYLPYIGTNSNSSDSPSSNSPDYSSPTTNSDGSCKPPYIKDGVVGVYASVGGSCQLFTAPSSAIYIKENQPTCQNKINYATKEVEIGQEKYIAMDDNKEYKISQCEYTPPIALSSEIGKCKAIPDYQSNQALIQKQYFYVKDNQRIDVGNCTPTDEKISMNDDVNACDYRFDFINKEAIKQTQFFYMADNKKYNVGECVDKSGDNFKYPMYEDAANCPFTTLSDGVKLYQTKLVFNDLQGGKHDATSCRLIDTQGLKVFEEFAGYDYKDTSKQAIRKINQYFIGQGNQKIYLAKDVETNKAYPYQQEACGWTNNDIDKVSTMKFASFFQDTDENKKIYTQKCDDPNNLNETRIAYVPLSSRGKLVDTQQNKTLIPDSGGLKIYGTNDYIQNTGNSSKNISGADSAASDRGNTQECLDGWPEINDHGRITYGFKGLKNLYTQEQIAGLNIFWGNNGRGYHINAGSQAVYSNDFPNCAWNTKADYFTNQTIAKYEVESIYLRGDGSRLELPSGEIKYYAE
ncbi:hypothetical protein BKH41_08500 [Helicobacter sp. 12S02232-10]|uniref:hypothetical protein n=1 Tax=Helicobacter sp. 12S02232-10 TaxID=1476197 RepID=UPI000BA63C03|nr:hypothetical protein [Helicobacter sp. 12S02232-10]PAF46739.1 hypothetical protein BKH41_08500 [Helicobacter sp. 12S02232-10]